MPTAASIQRGMTSVGSNTTGTTPTGSTTSMPEAAPTLSERELMKIEFYKTYDVMTGVRIAATLSGFFSLMVLLVVYKSRCKSNRQLDDPRLTAAAAAAVAEAEAEERALAAALEAIARLPPKPARGPRRSLCVDVMEPRLPVVAPRFASVGGDYDSLLSAPMRAGRLGPHRRCSSVTCSSTASSYLERRGSAMVMPCLPPPPSYPRHATAYDEPWELYHPIDIQVIQPTPELSPCGSEAGLYGSAAAAAAASLRQEQQEQRDYEQAYRAAITAAAAAATAHRRAPLASMGSVDPPEPDSRSLGSDSVFRERSSGTSGPRGHGQEEGEGERAPDTEDEVSGFSTDSSDGTPAMATSTPALKRFLKVPPKKKRPPERWDGCAGCVPRRRRRRPPAPAPGSPAACQTCMTISASVEALSRSSVLSTTTTTSSSQNSMAASGLSSPPPLLPTTMGGLTSSPIELKHRPLGPSALQQQRQQQQQQQQQQKQQQTTSARLSSSPPPPAVWSQETLF